MILTALKDIPCETFVCLIDKYADGIILLLMTIVVAIAIVGVNLANRR